MSNPWRYRCRVQGVRRVFHPRRVSLSRLHLLRHCERSVQRVGGSCFSLSICCEDPPEHSLCDQGYGLTRQCDPTTMRQIGTPGSPAAAYVVSTPGEDSSRPCSSRKHFWLGIYATTDIFYGPCVCIYMLSELSILLCQAIAFRRHRGLPCPRFP
jgi:hypothetical protein